MRLHLYSIVEYFQVSKYIENLPTNAIVILLLLIFIASKKVWRIIVHGLSTPPYRQLLTILTWMKLAVRSKMVCRSTAHKLIESTAQKHSERQKNERSVGDQALWSELLSC